MAGVVYTVYKPHFLSVNMRLTSHCRHRRRHLAAPSQVHPQGHTLAPAPEALECGWRRALACGPWLVLSRTE